VTATPHTTAPILKPAQARARRSRLRARLSGLAFVLPALAVYGLFVILPLGRSIELSFYSWDRLGQPEWVGLANYLSVLSEPLLRSSLVNALTLIIFFAVIPVCAGLLLAAMIAGQSGRRMAGYRVVFFVPYVMPMVATGIIWRWIYQQNGAVNQALDLVGLGGFGRAWLGDLDFAIIAVGLIGSWILSGFCMMLFIAGTQRIDTTLYEAAMLDGAGPYWQFRAVTLPGLRREVSIALVVTTIAALASFDLVFVTTNGGPANTTVVPSLLVYRLAFTQQQVGQAASLAVVLTAFVLAIAGVVRRLSREPA
jgi:ABC-type sugar transport system permease subunit